MGVAISCGELAEVLQGTLQLADMPPLGGRCEPVRQMRLHSEAWNPGDVVWLPGSDDDQADVVASQLAFAGGALGVVSQRRVTAWPGGFSIEVPCLRQAGDHLRRWALEHYRGVQIACHARASFGLGRELILRVLESQFNLADWSDLDGSLTRQLRAWNQMSRATCLWTNCNQVSDLLENSRKSILSHEVIATITRPVIGAYDVQDTWDVLIPQGDDECCTVACLDAAGGRRVFTVRRGMGENRVALEADTLFWSSGRLFDVALVFATLRLVGCLPEAILHRLRRELAFPTRLVA